MKDIFQQNAYTSHQYKRTATLVPLYWSMKMNNTLPQMKILIGWTRVKNNLLQTKCSESVATNIIEINQKKNKIKFFFILLSKYINGSHFLLFILFMF